MPTPTPTNTQPWHDDDGCHVWWLSASDISPLHYHILDQSERSCAPGNTPEAQLYLATRVITRLVLGTAVGADPSALQLDRNCLRCGGPHGKPRLVGGGMHFSVSHTAGRAAVAICKSAPIGIDIEACDPRLDAGTLSAAMLSPAERRAAGGRLDAILTYWTRKEALIKALNAGSRTHPRDIDASTDPATSTSALGTCRLQNLQPGDGYVAALARVGGTSPRVTIHQARTLALP